MAKRVQKRTNRHNIDTPLDTSTRQKLREKENLSLFPTSLLEKKYKRVDSFLGIDEDWQSSLEFYLKKKNPEYLFEAIKENNGILQGKGRNLKYEELGFEDEVYTMREKEKTKRRYKSNFVDAHTIIQ